MATANKNAAVAKQVADDKAFDSATTVTEGGEVVAIAGTAVSVFKPVLVRVITVPLFKWETNRAVYYKIDGPMFIGKAINEGAGKTKKEPATLMMVTDLETGEKGQCIVGAVLKSVLIEEYPEDAYVGKCFAFKQRKIVGKDYNGVDVAEIEQSGG